MAWIIPTRAFQRLGLASIIIGIISVIQCGIMMAAAADQFVGEGVSIANPNGICAQLVLKGGLYDCQEFKVPTRDGYILAMQRIRSSKMRPTKGPVFLYHGMMQGGDIWVLNGPNESLGFILADAGYEVWLGSSRSSKFSYGHVTYKPSDAAYWNWGLDDLAAQDLPSMLRFVHAQTNQLIYYVGYSQGTMAAFAAFSSGAGGAASLIKKAAMLSPVAYLNHVRSPVVSVVAWLSLDKVLLDAGIHQFNLSNDAGKQVIDTVCKHIKQSNCYNQLLSLVTGPNCCMDKSLIPYYGKFELQATSMKNLAQMAQFVRKGKFEMFDYGWVRNLAHYGDFFPPMYNLQAIPRALPLLLAYGGEDQLADQEDIQELLQQQILPSTTQLLFIPQFAHVDFVLGGLSAKTLVYDKLILFFQ